jgi:hypothetical protein
MSDTRQAHAIADQLNTAIARMGMYDHSTVELVRSLVREDWKQEPKVLEALWVLIDAAEDFEG